MRLWILVCVRIACVADVAAIVLLLAGHDVPTSSVVICIGAALTAGAGILLVIQPRPVVQVSAETVVSLPETSPEVPVPTAVASEPSESEPVDGDPLDNRPWLKLVEESVALFDELDRHRVDFDAPRQEVAEHVICRLQEILERCGVEQISGDANFDRNRHQPEGRTRVLPGATVKETLSPGFRVGKRILRRARVCVVNPTAPEAPG